MTTIINLLACRAWINSNFSKCIKACVIPQDGHSTPKIVFHKQGIPMSMPDNMFKMEENSI